MRRRYPHRVTIQRLERSRDPNTGAIRESWADYSTSVPAHVIPLSGRELIAANAEHSEVRARIEMRFRNDLNASMRILHRGDVFNIHALLADNDTGTRWLNAMCSYGLNEG